MTATKMCCELSLVPFAVGLKEKQNYEWQKVQIDSCEFGMHSIF